MLQNIKCSPIVSLQIDLTFDDCRANKSVTVAVGDLVDVDFNYNGMRRQINGKVLTIYAEGSDPKKWYMVVDSANAYSSETYKFCPMNILDITVVAKGDAIQYIASTNDYTNIKALRVVKGTLQYTQDGKIWFPILTAPQYIIEDENYGCCPKPHHIRDDEHGIRF